MQTINNTQIKPGYDPRWFIWTIVFLVVVGISLTSYILLSESGNNPQYVSIVRASANKR